MKCFFASIIDNIKEIIGIKKPIIITITADEETELEGINLVIKALKERNVKPLVSIIGEPTNLSCCTESNGCYEYEIRLKGRACHSSNPQNGINAIYIMAKLINKIEKLSNKFENTTLNVGVAGGGEKINIVADSAFLKFDIRTNSEAIKMLLLEEIEAYLKEIKLDYEGFEFELINSLSIPCLEKLDNVVTNILIKNNNITEDKFSAGSEAGYFKSLGGEAFLFGAGDLSLAHTANEFLDLVKYEEYNKLFLKILKEI